MALNVNHQVTRLLVVASIIIVERFLLTDIAIKLIMKQADVVFGVLRHLHAVRLRVPGAPGRAAGAAAGGGEAAAARGAGAAAAARAASVAGHAQATARLHQV